MFWSAWTCENRSALSKPCQARKMVAGSPSLSGNVAPTIGRATYFSVNELHLRGPKFVFLSKGQGHGPCRDLGFGAKRAEFMVFQIGV
ncbi:MAG: hypothetical protein CM1200mP9_01460 [Gammaproteobacteria bacterium]|nr:MAG: hypothetical protein CM1200mP9_01460 [Gammaproteobacteria bacterium]